MSGLLNGVGDVLNTALDAAVSGGETVLDRLTNNTRDQQRNFEKDGFIVPPIPAATGDGLPSSKIPSQQAHRNRRHIIHWFVPEVGVINMYINPQRIDYKYSKQINSERTKGGFVIQYWGENLPILSISGHTGSSGIEGINVLHEIYRSEQLNFDPIGLTMASNSMISGLGDLVNGVGQAFGSATSFGGAVGGALSSVANGILGLNPLTQTILPRNSPTLASLAFSVEMYYAGKVYRGYFTSMSVNESADRIGLFDYSIEFTVTQERGYRLNTQGWHRSANNGPSDNSEGGIPLSFGTGLSQGGSLPTNDNAFTNTISTAFNNDLSVISGVLR